MPYEYLYHYMYLKNNNFFLFSFVLAIIVMVIRMEYIIIFVVLVIILLAILKATKKDAGLDFNKLVEYLGGKENIIDTEINLSRFKATLKDVTKANKEGIQKLGAKGIVEIDNQLKIILGPNSKQLKKYIDDLK